jgi:formylglycine-generating enzyme required for sulfatase activity
MDLYEAPNRIDALPLVMYDFDEAAAWCEHRGKRLCYDDEWLQACEGPDAWAYPYDSAREPGQCNDDKVWRVYSQSLLSAWPNDAATPEVETVDQLFDIARAAGDAAAASADHVESLYQGETPADSPGCVGPYGVYDLVGNVEEWTRRRTSNDPNFEGNLKGRDWAESRTCQSNVTGHADPFRFYEIGFRCCRDAD